jgi:mono/diheme cytochrome c family protein
VAIWTGAALPKQDKTEHDVKRIILGLFIVVGCTDSRAQELGDPEAGLALAREVCSSCHAILAGQTRSPNSLAPSFEQIAKVPGMTPLALRVSLQTSHKTMPNIMLEQKELRDVIAYITGLQVRP